MKRVTLWMSLFTILLMVSCTLPSSSRLQAPTAAATSTLSPDEVQTQISAMLTIMPTSTAAQPANAATPTLVLPTVAVGGQQPTSETVQGKATQSAPDQPAAQSPTATAVPPTATSAPAVSAATKTPTATARPQGPTATLPAGDPRARLGSPKSTDPMNNANTWIWPTGSDLFSSGEFENGSQVVTALGDKDGWRLANPAGHDFSNAYIEGTFKTNTCSGADHYGIMARVPVLQDADQGYLFSVTCDGRYSLRRWDGTILPKGQMKKLIDWTASSAIHKGSNQTNRLGIFTVGSRLILYVNGTLLGEAHDDSYPSGYFGVLVGPSATSNLVIQVDEMSYWENVQP